MSAQPIKFQARDAVNFGGLPLRIRTRLPPRMALRQAFAAMDQATRDRLSDQATSPRPRIIVPNSVVATRAKRPIFDLLCQNRLIFFEFLPEHMSGLAISLEEEW